MLCDEISALPAPAEIGPRILRQRLVHAVPDAQRFVLSEAATRACWSVIGSKPSSLLSGAGLCRPPFRKTWVEFRLPQVFPGRLGLMVEADRDLAGPFEAVVVAEHDGGATFSGLFGDFTKPTSEPSEVVVDPRWSEAERAAAYELFQRMTAAGTMADNGLGVSICGWMLMAFLMLLNTPNSVAQEHVTHDKLNKARTKRGKVPLLDYHVVDLRLTKSQRRRLEANGVDQRDMRQHLVRGHFKVRKTGVFWWMPYLRGNPELGRVDKHYEVEE